MNRRVLVALTVAGTLLIIPSVSSAAPSVRKPNFVPSAESAYEASHATQQLGKFIPIRDARDRDPTTPWVPPTSMFLPGQGPGPILNHDGTQGPRPPLN